MYVKPVIFTLLVLAIVVVVADCEAVVVVTGAVVVVVSVPVLVVVVEVSAVVVVVVVGDGFFLSLLHAASRARAQTLRITIRRIPGSYGSLSCIGCLRSST